ncbi:hypothetical protein GCM10027578_27000 [Spirosoma luteolum]
MKSVAIGFMIGLFVTENAVAQQISQLAVDTVSNLINESLPFDRPFIIKVRGGNSTSIISAFLLEWRIKKNNKSLVLAKDADGNTIAKNLFIPRSNIFKRKDGVDVYIPALPPNKNLAILFAHQFDGEFLDDIYRVNELLRQGQTYQAEISLNSIPPKVKQQVKPVFGLSGLALDQLRRVTTFNFEGVDSTFAPNYISFFNSQLKTKYDSIASQVQSHTYNNLTESNLKTILTEAGALEIVSAELNTLAVLVKKSQLPGVLIGTVSINVESATADEYDIKKRIDNLNASIKALEKIRKTLLLLGVRTGITLPVTIEIDLAYLSDDLIANRNLIRGKYTLIKSAIESNKNLNYPNWALANNELTDIKTRGTYQVIPEIGLVTIFGIGNEQNETIVRPYLGASIYLRPIDKSVPYKYLNNQLLHRLSFNLGVTLGKVDKGEFSDLASNFTLLVGANVKIIREMSFSFGTAIMQRQNSNPAINAKQASINPYVGLSFDIDIANGVQKLTGKLFP